jgi:hypothetical protein
MNRPTPDILYRYRHLDGEHRDWTADIMKASALYFTSPAHFNDPFDGKVYYNSTGSPSQKRRLEQRLLKDCAPSLNRRERRKKAARDIRLLSGDANWLPDVVGRYQDEVDRLGVLCLSECRDNVLLWSHYAAGHNGLCLGFRVLDDQKFFNRVKPVSYLIERPTINLHDEPRTQYDAFLLTKAKAWAYEREWRIIDHDNGPGNHKFHTSALCEVIIGARLSEEDKSFVRACLTGRKNPVSIFQTRPVRGRFELEIYKVYL